MSRFSASCRACALLLPLSCGQSSPGSGEGETDAVDTSGVATETTTPAGQSTGAAGNDDAADTSGTTSDPDTGTGGGAESSSTGVDVDVDAEMIDAIVACTPAQHPTEARFAKIEGSEIDVLVQCDEFPAFGDHIRCQNSYLAFGDWTGGVWQWTDWEFTLPAGGGHYDYGGNELYLAQLGIIDGKVSVDWSRPIDPQPLNDVTCGSPTSGPNADHTYAGPVYVESRGEYWHYAGGGFPATTACEGQDVEPGKGQWVHTNDAWTNVEPEARMNYLTACYIREIDQIHAVSHGAAKRVVVKPSEAYATTVEATGGWLSTVGYFDAAVDQNQGICYWSAKDFGIVGETYDPVTGAETQVFSDPEAPQPPSLSIEHSTGNLIIVGTSGYVLHIDTETGERTDISAPAATGIPDGAGQAHFLYGKFDMIEKVPCVGIGMADARDGVYLMTLPASVCAM